MFQTVPSASGLSDRAVPVAVAPNGGRRTAADHPRLPVTPAELARTAAECRDAGAAMIHVHVRDAAGAHLLDAGAYRAALAAIRGEIGDALVVQITSESLGRYRPAEQRAVVAAVRPEAVSLALCELLPPGGSEAEFAAFLDRLHAERVAVQFILYSRSDADRLASLVARGLVPGGPPAVLYVMGRYRDGQVAEPADLAPFLAPDAPRFGSWMSCAFGPREAECVIAGARQGGGVRIGFENNLQLPDGSVAADNAALVRATIAGLEVAGLAPMSTTALRQLWRIG